MTAIGDTHPQGGDAKQAPGASLSSAGADRQSPENQRPNPQPLPEIADIATQGWQPIETAPRDGTWFWGFWPDCHEDQNRYCSTSWLDDSDESRFVDDSDWRDWQQPTHWMPLPPPPAHLEQESRG